MQFLNKEIELLAKHKKSKSLVKKPVSCGIFQEYDVQEIPTDKE